MRVLKYYVENKALFETWKQGKWKQSIILYSRGELFMCPRECYFGVYFPSCAATRELNTKITLEWAHKQFVTRMHTLFYFFTRHDESINIAKNDDLHTSSSCLTRSLYVLFMTSQSIGDDVTMFRQVWREHVTSDIKLVRYPSYSRRHSRLVV